jgi:hypothetical protein
MTGSMFYVEIRSGDLWHRGYIPANDGAEAVRKCIDFEDEHRSKREWTVFELYRLNERGLPSGPNLDLGVTR